jgi:mRNA degradation ribonuclease J1/J2
VLPDQNSNSNTKKKRILAVDDEPDITLTVKAGLEATGLFQVNTFNDPELALSSFKPRLYDIVLLDFKMPKMYGYELYDEMKKIDIRPKENSSYVRSSTEPFNDDMKLDQERVKKWLVHFGLLRKESDWYHIHVSGHGSRDQLQHIVRNSNSKKVIPIHTEYEEYYANWHDNVVNVTLNSSLEI